MRGSYAGVRHEESLRLQERERLSKKEKPEYEVFKVEKWVDLDLLAERWDELDKVTTSSGLAVNEHFYYAEPFEEDVALMDNSRVGPGDILHLYPKKKTKLERISDIVIFLLRDDLETHAESYESYLTEIKAILNEPEGE